MTLDKLADEIHETAINKGFWDHYDNRLIYAEKIALIHSELSEALEALRAQDHPLYAEELGDVLIRTLDLMAASGIPIDVTVREKMDKNRARQFMHGKAF